MKSDNNSMNRIVIFAIALLLFSSCSQLLLEPAEPEIMQFEDGVPATKSAVGMDAKYDPSAMRYYFQTNRRVILMHHVVYRDSAYVQTLSDDEMKAFGITDEQKEFSRQYVVQLNEFKKQQ